MARRYQTKRETWGWNMALCEERLLIGVYEDLAPRIIASPWKVTWEQDFYQNGVGVLDGTLDEINSHLRRIARDELSFTETAVDDYARITDRPAKCERRRLMQEAYRSLDTVGKVRWIEEARDDIAVLPPPVMTWEGFREHQERRKAMPEQTLRQQNLARLAEKVVPIKPLPPDQLNGHADAIELALKRLKLARKPETIAAVMATIAPTDALTIADMLAETGQHDFVDDLVMRSLG